MFLLVFALMGRKEGGYLGLTQDILTEEEMETILNEVGLPQKHKAAPPTGPDSEVEVSGAFHFPSPCLYTSPGNSLGVDGLGSGQVPRHADI